MSDTAELRLFAEVCRALAEARAILATRSPGPAWRSSGSEWNLPRQVRLPRSGAVCGRNPLIAFCCSRCRGEVQPNSTREASLAALIALAARGSNFAVALSPVRWRTQLACVSP